MKQYKMSKDAPVKSIKEIRQKTTDGSTLHLVLDVGAVGMSYVTAANGAIFPENSAEDVEEVAKLLNIDSATMARKICLKPNAAFDGNRKMQFPIPAEGMTPREIFTKLVDFHDVLSIKDYLELSKFCKEDPTADKYFDGEENAKADKEA